MQMKLQSQLSVIQIILHIAPVPPQPTWRRLVHGVPPHGAPPNVFLGRSHVPSPRLVQTSCWKMQLALHFTVHNMTLGWLPVAPQAHSSSRAVPSSSPSCRSCHCCRYWDASAVCSAAPTLSTPSSKVNRGVCRPWTAHRAEAQHQGNRVSSAVLVPVCYIGGLMVHTAPQTGHNRCSKALGIRLHPPPQPHQHHHRKHTTPAPAPTVSLRVPRKMKQEGTARAMKLKSSPPMVASVSPTRAVVPAPAVSLRPQGTEAEP